MALLGLATLTARSDEPAPTPSRPEVVGAASARASAEIAGGPTSESSAPASENVSGVAADSSRALWETHVRDLLRERCARCHGAPVRKSRLDLTSPESILAGGRRGAAVVPGDPDSSLLVRFVAADAEKRMPPEGDPLSDEEIALLRRWVERLDPEAVTQREADRSLEAAATREASPATPLPPPGSVRPRVVIDLLIESAWAERGIEPAAVSSDETFVRRIYLDLVGRIPTIAEREQFLGDVDSLKRERLADQLLLSDEWAVRMREMLDVVLLGRGGERARRERAQHGWHDFLERSIRENRPWSEIARDIILARSGDARSAGASWFAFEHRNDHQAIAERLAPAILGARVQCAQCHDHPIAPEIEQRHYWGLVAFYGRSKNVSTPQGPAIAESAVGGYAQFADLDGKSHPAIPIFLDGRAAAEEWPEGDEKPAEDASLYTVPPAAEGEPARESVPTYSRRAELARLVTSSERLDQSFVNRLWALLVGRGFVHPVDAIDSAHPASHPALLDWLARDFRSSGHDIRRLAREIVLSRAYQLDSRPRDGAPVPADDAFARGLEKPLSAEALARSLAVALGGTLADPKKLALDEASIQAFPEIFVEVYSPTIRQALFLSNGKALADLLLVEDGNLLDRLRTLSGHDERVREAFLSCFGRSPDEEERRIAVEYLAARENRLEDALSHVVWSLVTSAEFQLNH